MCVPLPSPYLHQAGSNNHSLEDHEHHMSSIQAELEVFKQLWASPAAGAGGGGALAPAGGGGGDDEVGTAAPMNPMPTAATHCRLLVRQ